jgi:hypothetical protein
MEGIPVEESKSKGYRGDGREPHGNLKAKGKPVSGDQALSVGMGKPVCKGWIAVQVSW